MPSKQSGPDRTMVIVYAVFFILVVIVGIALSGQGKSEAPTTTKDSDSSVSTEEKVPMPDVVCHNLQDAQDEIQEAGVFFSDSRDATGKGRAQVMDRNWIVVAQSPQPGALIGEGDAMLSVVKYGEPNSC